MVNLSILVLTLIFGLPRPNDVPRSVHDFEITSIDGEKIQLSQFKGKKILIINTASKCGFTKQYADLQKLSEQYKERLVLIGFPSNDFGGQEPGSHEEIAEFCQQNYGVTFLIAEKTPVKGGKKSPLFKYLTTSENPDFTGEIKWNFEKFLVDENGKLIHRFRSATKPLAEELVSEI